MREVRRPLEGQPRKKTHQLGCPFPTYVLTHDPDNAFSCYLLYHSTSQELFANLTLSSFMYRNNRHVDYDSSHYTLSLATSHPCFMQI